ncbi:MAG: glutathione S-transferase [Alphaproteobacteria bacterium]|nr:glutathione S-transferase [Alphaproteobacteria bacterium]
MTPTPITLSGAPGSPYTRKMVSLLRYRRIPYKLLQYGIAGPPGLPQAKVRLLPTFYLPNAQGELEAIVDSTPIIRRLEQDFEGRSVLPTNPVIAFIDYLLDDYADEWLTKAMFHYRWHYKADEQKAGQILPRWSRITASDEDMAAASKFIAERQVSRLYVVGSNNTTAPVIEASYERFLDLFNAHLKHFPFLMGNRPGASDFATFGQLTQLTHFDPTPMAVTLAKSPRTYAWVEICEDLSGVEPKESDWLDAADIPATTIALLKEFGRVYVPALLANAKAIASGADTFETEIDHKPWKQQTFQYQAKCLQWIRNAYADLGLKDRTAVDQILAGTSIPTLFQK